MSRSRDHLDLETLSDLIDDQAGAGARADAERHLASCTQCAARKAGLESAASAVAGLAKVSPTAAETRAMRAAVLEAKPRPRVAWWPAISRRVLVASGALALVLAGVIGFAVVNGGTPPSSTAGVAAAPVSGVNGDTGRAGHAATKMPAPVPSVTGPSGINGDVEPLPQPFAASAPVEIYSGTTSGSAILVPASPPPSNFANQAEVASYIAGQATVGDEARTLTAGSASVANLQYLHALDSSIPDSAANALPPSPALAPQPAASPAAPTSTGTGSSGNLVSPAQPAEPLAPAPLTMARCALQVVAQAPQPAAAIEAAPITFQGTPAWLVVVATTPVASPSPSQTLTRERFWIQSQAACSTLAAGTV